MFLSFAILNLISCTKLKLEFDDGIFEVEESLEIFRYSKFLSLVITHSSSTKAFTRETASDFVIKDFSIRHFEIFLKLVKDSSEKPVVCFEDYLKVYKMIDFLEFDDNILETYNRKLAIAFLEFYTDEDMKKLKKNLHKDYFLTTLKQHYFLPRNLKLYYWHNVVFFSSKDINAIRHPPICADYFGDGPFFSFDLSTYKDFLYFDLLALKFTNFFLNYHDNVKEIVISSIEIDRDFIQKLNSLKSITKITYSNDNIDKLLHYCNELKYIKDLKLDFVKTRVKAFDKLKLPESTESLEIIQGGGPGMLQTIKEMVNGSNLISLNIQNVLILPDVLDKLGNLKTFYSAYPSTVENPSKNKIPATVDDYKLFVIDYRHKLVIFDEKIMNILKDPNTITFTTNDDISSKPRFSDVFEMAGERFLITITTFLPIGIENNLDEKIKCLEEQLFYMIENKTDLARLNSSDIEMSEDAVNHKALLKRNIDPIYKSTNSNLQAYDISFIFYFPENIEEEDNPWRD